MIEMCNKKILKINDYKTCLLDNEVILKPQQWFRSATNYVYTEEIRKNTLSSNDEKILQTFDTITSYPYRTSVGKVCKTKLLSKYK